MLKQYSVPAREFEKYFLSLSPGRDSNPWLRLLWEELFSCDWFQPSTKPPCDRLVQHVLHRFITQGIAKRAEKRNELILSCVPNLTIHFVVSFCCPDFDRQTSPSHIPWSRLFQTSSIPCTRLRTRCTHSERVTVPPRGEINSGSACAPTTFSGQCVNTVKKFRSLPTCMQVI